MAINQFKELLDNANTLKAIADLRNTCKASHFINKCKTKIYKMAEKEGFKCLTVSIKTLKSLTNNTDCGQFFQFEVPAKNRTFKGYKTL